MRHFTLLKTLLLAIGFIMGGVNLIWAATIETMGSTDHGWQINNHAYTIAANKTLTLNFTVSSVNSANSTNGYFIDLRQNDVAIMSVQPNGGFWYKDHGWWYWDGNEKYDRSWNDIIENDVTIKTWDAVFKDDVINGASVELTIKRIHTQVLYYADIMTSTSVRHYLRIITKENTFTENDALTVVLGADYAVLTAITDKLSDESIIGTLVGKEDNSVDFGTNNVEYSLGANETLSLNFINYSSKIGWGDNWFLEIQNGTKYLDLQADRAGWDFGMQGDEHYFYQIDDTSSPGYFSCVSSSGSYWDNFPKALHKANVTLTVARLENVITITAVQKCTDGTVRTQTYTLTHNDFASNNVTVRLMARYAHLDLLPSSITTLPYYSNFTELSTAPFAESDATVNTVYDTNNGMYVIRPVGEKNGVAVATAFFDSDPSTPGNQEYNIDYGKQVTLSFTAFHGYYNYSNPTKFAIVNSMGTELVSYTYDPTSRQVTDVTLGGSTVAGFASFNAESRSGNHSANGFNDGTYPFVSTSGNNPSVTIVVRGDGYVSINFNESAISLNKTFNTTVNPSNISVNLDNIVITNSGPIGYDNNSGRCPGFANISIISSDVTSISTSISDSGWATLYTPYALDFSSFSSEFTAYTATLEGTTVTLNEVTNIPANTGVVLKGTAGTYNIPVIATSSTEKGDLKGSATDAKAYDTAYDYYYLAMNGGNAQFKKLTSGSIAAGKAYLQVAKSQGVKTFNVVFNDATGIAETVTGKSVSGAYFNLSGQRVANPQKGLYIVNGNKVIIK